MLYNDHFQNFKQYNIPRAQLIIADIMREVKMNKWCKQCKHYVQNNGCACLEECKGTQWQPKETQKTEIIIRFKDQRVQDEYYNSPPELETKRAYAYIRKLEIENIYKENKISELEAEKAELIEFLKDIHKTHALRYDKALEARILIESINGVKYEQSER